MIFPFYAMAYNITEECSYQTNDLWIKIVALCQECDIACDKMVYIGLNKNTGNYIVLTGKAETAPYTNNFKWYKFQNNNTTYYIDRDNTLTITEDDKTIATYKLESCG